MGRDTIVPSEMWSVGNDNNIKIREDRWLKRGVIGGLANHGEPTRVAELIIEEDRLDVQALCKLFDAQIVSEILTIPLKTLHAHDGMIWTGAELGQFTIKSAYNRENNRISQYRSTNIIIIITSTCPMQQLFSTFYRK